ncbi:MAG: hypothetical protein ACUVQH_08905 [Thermogutta sp.]
MKKQICRVIERLCVFLVAGILLFGSDARGISAEPSNSHELAGAFRVNITELIDKFDENTDWTPVIQKAMDELSRHGGGIVEIPAGSYRVNGHLVVPANVTLQGVLQTAPTARWGKWQEAGGSILLAYEGRGSEQGEPFIRLAARHATIKGLIVVYPEWKQTDVPPVPYPPCVGSFNTENVSVQDCLFVNPYEAIRLVRAHRHLLRNVTGYPIKRGLYVDECYDIGRVENVHFWPFGVTYRPSDPYCQWINLNGVAFEFARTDWHYVYNTFCFGYGIGYKFSKSSRGSANGNFLGIGADCCRRAVLVEDTQPPGLLITNGEFVGRWESKDSVTLEISPEASGRVSLTNCSFWGPIDRCVWLRSGDVQLTLTACHFCRWDLAQRGSPAIQLDAGRATIQGCSFDQDASFHITLARDVRSAVIVGNEAKGGLRVDNQAGARAQIGLNAVDPIEWTSEAKAHYRIEIGRPGDGRYLVGWYGGERGQSPFRWTGSSSRMLLPVVANRRYQMTITAQVPKALQDAEINIVSEGKTLGRLQQGKTTVEIPAQSAEQITIEIRTPTWIPKKVIPDSQDERELGVQVFSILMKAEGPAERVFDANRGEWIPPETSNENTR